MGQALASVVALPEGLGSGRLVCWVEGCQVPHAFLVFCRGSVGSMESAPSPLRWDCWL